MTLLDVKNQLISHFVTKTVFAPEDTAGIQVPTELEPCRAGLVRAAFEDLEKAEMVRMIEGPSWILTRPFSDFVQDVAISPVTAEVVANTVNGFIKANELDWPPVDKINIDEQAVMILVDIIHEMLEIAMDRDMGPFGQDPEEDDNDRN
jgi:hypothetical protein